MEKLIGVCVRLACFVMALLLIFLGLACILLSGIESVMNMKDGVIPAIKFLILLAFRLGIILPCFLVLGKGWVVSNFIFKKQVFSNVTTVILKQAAQILLFDILAFTIGNIIFLYLGWISFYFEYVGILFLGLIILFVLKVLSYYVKEVARIKEENECFI